MKLLGHGAWAAGVEPPPLKRASLGARALVALAARLGPHPESTGVYQALGREKLGFTRRFEQAVTTRQGFAGLKATDGLLKYTGYGSAVSLALALGCRGPFWTLEADELAGGAALQQAAADLKLGRCERALVCSVSHDGRAFLLGLEREGPLEVRVTWSAERHDAAAEDLHGVGALGVALAAGRGEVCFRTPDGRGLTVTVG